MTEEGHESGRRGYHNLLDSLLRDMKELSNADMAKKEGSELLELVMTRVSDRVNAPYFEDLPAPIEDRVAKLEHALTDQGFAPRISHDNNQVEVRLCNCPFRAVALCEETVCLSDQRLIAGILGVEPVRQSSIRDGVHACTIPDAETTTTCWIHSCTTSKSCLTRTWPKRKGQSF